MMAKENSRHPMSCAIETTLLLQPPPASDDSSCDEKLCSQAWTPDLLIVEDDAFLVEALKRHLRPRGYDIRSADAVELAIEQVKTSRPDLILLDVKLPGADGWWLAEWLQTSSETADIPLIVLTGLMQPDVQARAQAYGAFACLTKPMVTERLLSTIADALQTAT